MKLTQPMERLLTTLHKNGRLWYGLAGGREGRECPRSTADALIRRGLAYVLPVMGTEGDFLIITADGKTVARELECLDA